MSDEAQTDDLAARLESEVIGYSISLGLTESQCDLLHAAASRLRTSTHPEQPALVDHGDMLKVRQLRDTILQRESQAADVAPAYVKVSQGEIRELVPALTRVLGALEPASDRVYAIAERINP